MKIITGLTAFCVLMLGLLFVAALLCRGDTCMVYGFFMLPIFAVSAVSFLVGAAIWRSERHDGPPPKAFQVSVCILALLIAVGAVVARGLLQ